MLIAALIFAATPEPAVTPVFIDKLVPGWSFNTWNDTKCEIQTDAKGETAIAIVFTQPWGGCALDHKDAKMATVALAPDAFDALVFDVDSDDVSLGALSVYLDNGSERMKVRPHLQGKRARLPMGDLNNTGGEFSRIVFFNAGRIGGIAVKVDNIRFENATPASEQAKTAAERAISIAIDPQKRHAISPYIYGDNSQKNRPSMRLVRLGGNRWSTYNYTNNASNSGIDFGPHSNDGHLSQSSEPARPVIEFVGEAKKRNAAALVTVPMLDWIAADKKGLVTAPAGEGNPRFTPNDVALQEKYVDLVEKSRDGATVFYALDNEPGLWSSTHPLVHPDGALYAELADKTARYGAMVKKRAPEALVFGGVMYGWAEMVNLQHAADGRGRDYTSFLLQSWHDAEKKAGRRVVDVLDLHWYTEVKSERGKILDSQSRTPSAQEATNRMQAPRSLWDPTYTEKTWIAKTIGGPVKLLPRVQHQIAEHYPGTKLAITEYNYGGGQHISGAIAQADVLGIFGRENVFAANLWAYGYQKEDAYVFSAFDMFLDYDQKGGHVGKDSLATTTSDIEASSAYAMQDGARDLELVLINKSADALNATIALGTKAFKTAQPYVLTSAGKKPVPGAAITVAGDKATYQLPPYSVTTLVFR